MLRWLYVALHLLVEAGSARRDARVRFLKAQVEILRRKLGGNRVIPSPADRAHLLAIGQELGHDVSDVNRNQLSRQRRRHSCGRRNTRRWWVSGASGVAALLRPGAHPGC